MNNVELIIILLSMESRLTFSRYLHALRLNLIFARAFNYYLAKQKQSCKIADIIKL